MRLQPEMTVVSNHLATDCHHKPESHSRGLVSHVSQPPAAVHAVLAQAEMHGILVSFLLNMCSFPCHHYHCHRIPLVYMQAREPRGQEQAFRLKDHHVYKPDEPRPVPFRRPPTDCPLTVSNQAVSGMSNTP